METKKKNRTISVRVTEDQFYKLTSTLYREKKNLSQFLRESIEKYGQSCRSERRTLKIEGNSNNRSMTIKN